MSGNERRGKAGRKREAAIAALLSCSTIEHAARAVGVSDATLRRWLQHATFKKEYQIARRHVVDGAVTRLQQVTSEAVDCLKRNLTCGSPPSEIAAARAIIDHALKAVELVDLAERLDSLEHAASAKDRE